jgi:hypothetical protein
VVRPFVPHLSALSSEVSKNAVGDRHEHLADARHPQSECPLVPRLALLHCCPLVQIEGNVCGAELFRVLRDPAVPRF